MARKRLLLAALLSLAACGKKAPPVAPETNAGSAQTAAPAAAMPSARLDTDLPLPKPYAKWSPKARAYWDQKISREQKKYWLEQETLDPLRQKQEEWVRRNYIRPAPAGFKPENVQYKIRLILVPEKSMIRKGEPFRYRLEMQNAGLRPARFFEPHSNFLLGNHFIGEKYDFYFMPPGSKEWSKFILAMIRGIHGGDGGDSGSDYLEIPRGERMTEEERAAWLRRKNAEENIKDELCATLQPGETLVSKQWGGPTGSFNEIPTEGDWSRSGTYRVKVVYDDSPSPPPSEEQIQRMLRKYGHSREDQMKDYRRRSSTALGLVESNVVAVEVAQ